MAGGCSKGGAQGLGLAMAKRFVDEGARVVLGTLNSEGLEKAVAELGGGSIATSDSVDPSWDADPVSCSTIHPSAVC